MFCRFCGAEIKEGETKCPSCNRSLTTGIKKSKHEKKEKEKMKTSKKILIGVISTLVVILAISIGALVYYIKSPAREIYMDIEEGNYQTVNRLYYSDVKGNFLQEKILNYLLVNQIDRTVEQFKNGEIDYTQTTNKLTAIGSVGVNEITKKTEENVESLNNLNTSMTAYEQAEAFYEQGNYQEAMEEYKKVIEDDSNYEEAQKKIEECVNKYKESIASQTENLETEEDYEKALQVMEIAVGVLSDDEEMKDRQTAIQNEYANFLKTEALSEGTQYIADGNYTEAFACLQKALEKNPNDSELKNMQETAQNSYFENLDAQVNSFLEAEEYDSAESILEEARVLFPDNEKIAELSQNVSNARPVMLSTIKVSDSYQYATSGKLTINEDVVGNIYDPENLFSLSSSTADKQGYATYYLNGQYTRMCGTLAVSDDSQKNASGRFTVYDETGNVLYDLNNILRISEPIEFEVDLGNTKWVTIAVTNTKDYSYGGNEFKVLVANTVLYKN